MRQSAQRRETLAHAALLALACVACTGGGKDVSLSKSEDDGPPPVVRVPSNGPKLGSVAEVTPIFERPKMGSKQLGYLHAGAQVARTSDPYARKGCEGGWYAIFPRGFVCAAESATLDLAHPTLAAMALEPAVDKPLPYTYARTRTETELFEHEPNGGDKVREIGKLKRRAAMAVVGSWNARDPSGEALRLALLTNGKFVRASDLEPAKPSEFRGIELTDKRTLPVGFIVKRGVRAWKLDGSEAEKLGELEYHAPLDLTGRFRSLGQIKYWALDEERWVRHRDATIVQKRNVFPDFVNDAQKWIDISLVTGTLVLYEGKRPVFVTLVSVARESGDLTRPVAAPPLGTFEIVGKHLTLAGKSPEFTGEAFQTYDIPWAIELKSGTLLHAAYWHDRFGIEHGNGSIQVSPDDAARVWHWATPELPTKWHGVVGTPDATKTFVVVRK